MADQVILIDYRAIYCTYVLHIIANFFANDCNLLKRWQTTWNALASKHLF